MTNSSPVDAPGTERPAPNAVPRYQLDAATVKLWRAMAAHFAVRNDNVSGRARTVRRCRADGLERARNGKRMVVSLRESVEHGLRVL
jgi:hypothetical protein